MPPTEESSKPSQTVDVVAGSGQSATTEPGDGKKTRQANTEPSSFDTEFHDEKGEATEEGDADATKEEGAEEETKGDDLPDLGEYKADDTGVVAKFNNEYLTEDGAPNVERLSAEWGKNEAAGEGKLNEATYAWLEDQLGYGRDFVRQIEQGQLALRSQAANAIYDKAGGKEQWDAAIAWARDGGYSKDDQARFNTIIGGADAKAREDAIDALIARFGKSTGTASKDAARQPRRPARPERRDVGDKAADVPMEGFDTVEDYQKAFNEARSKGDHRAVRTARARAKASKWYRGGKR